MSPLLRQEGRAGLDGGWYACGGASASPESMRMHSLIMAASAPTVSPHRIIEPPPSPTDDSIDTAPLWA